MRTIGCLTTYLRLVASFRVGSRGNDMSLFGRIVGGAAIALALFAAVPASRSASKIDRGVTGAVASEGNHSSEIVAEGAMQVILADVRVVPHNGSAILSWRYNSYGGILVGVVSNIAPPSQIIFSDGTQIELVGVSFIDTASIKTYLLGTMVSCDKLMHSDRLPLWDCYTLQISTDYTARQISLFEVLSDNGWAAQECDGDYISHAMAEESELTRYLNERFSNRCGENVRRLPPLSTR